MLTKHFGVVGPPSAARAMGEHVDEQTLRAQEAAFAAYYQRRLPSKGRTIAEVRRDMDPRLSLLLGLDPMRVPSLAAITQMLAGNRADGKPLPGKQIQRPRQSLAELLGLGASLPPTPAEIGAVLSGRRADGVALPAGRAAAIRARFFALYGFHFKREPNATERDHMLAGRRMDGSMPGRQALVRGLAATRAPIAYLGLCWSADKSVSLAWAFAPTEAERAMIAEAHRDAVDAAMRHLEHELGRARKGKAGRDGYELGRICWICFDHYTARPTVEKARRAATADEIDTEGVTLRVAGDPQLHSHVVVPNVVLTDSGRVGGLDLQRLAGRLHEGGALYHAYLATNLRRHGVAVVLDEVTGAARLTAIPEHVRTAFGKRTLGGTKEARGYAASLGLDWDSLSDEQRIRLAKRGVQGDPLQAKRDDLSNRTGWRRQAAALGWQHGSVLGQTAVALPTREARLEQAYTVARGILNRALERKAVVDVSTARLAAARGLIASGVESPAEIDEIVRVLAARSMRQNGQGRRLIWGATAEVEGRRRAKLTTAPHPGWEAELMTLAQVAAADRSSALGATTIAEAMERSGHDYAASVDGQTQRQLIDRLGQGGRLVVAIGVTGPGRAAVLAPLIDAWQRDGRRVYVAALAWRRSDDLVGASIAEADRMVFPAFLERVANGQIRLTGRSVVVVDELGQLETWQLFRMLQVQGETGCQVVAMGDSKLCQAIEAAPVIDLLRRALGTAAVPETLIAAHQQNAREREASQMFREGRTADALAAKRGAGTAQLAAGGYREAVEHVADFWQARRTVNAHDPTYTLTVSAPRSADARAISTAIRERRRTAGELGPDEVVLDACDQTVEAFVLPLAVGDRVRLFARTNATYADRRRGIIGNDGSVLEVCAINAAGVGLRNAQGREGLVKWDTLRDPSSGRIRLSYGDVLWFDAKSGPTSSEHIHAMPGGTRGVNGYAALAAASGHRRAAYLVVSEGAERREISARRPPDDHRAITVADVWANMARNLARQPKVPAARDLLEQAFGIHRGTVHALQAGLLPAEQRAAAGQARTTLTHTWQRRHLAERLLELAQHMAKLAHQQGTVLAELNRLGPALRALATEAVAAIQPAFQRIARLVRQRHEARRQNKLDGPDPTFIPPGGSDG